MNISVHPYRLTSFLSLTFTWKKASKTSSDMKDQKKKKDVIIYLP